MAKYVEKNFKRIQLLMQFMTLMKKITNEFDCKELFGFSGYEVQKKIYDEIARQAEGG